MENQTHTSLTSNISPIAKNNLLQVANWGRIVAIVAFISAALSLLTVFRAPASSIAGTLIVTAISVILNYLLLQASINIKKGIESTEQGAFNEGLINLGRYFKFYAILLIIVIVFCVLAVFFAIAVGSAYRG